MIELRYQIQFESINLGRVPCQWRIIVHPQTAGQSTHVHDGAAAIHLSCVVTRSMAQPQHLKAGPGAGARWARRGSARGHMYITYFSMLGGFKAN